MATERVQLQPQLSWIKDQGNKPELIGQVLLWMVQAAPGEIRNGKTIHATDVGKKLGLLTVDASAGDAGLYN